MWIKEYVKLAFPTKYEDLDIRKAQALKYQNIPHALYRYRTFTSYNIESLKNGVEWQSYPDEFNDPFDASLKVSIEDLKKELFLNKTLKVHIDNLKKSGIELTEEEIQAIKEADNPSVTFTKISLNKDPIFMGKDDLIDDATAVIEKAIQDELDLMMDSARNSFKKGNLVSCYSETKDEVLMWSHYAENHTGFCIEYNFHELGPDHARSRLLYPVIYTEELFNATEFYSEALFKSPRKFNVLYGIYPTITKSKKWEYEREWRMVFPWGPGIALDDKENRLFYMPTPKKIYVGAKASEDNKRLIGEIAKEKGVSVYQMKLSKNGYSLQEELVYLPK